MFIYKTNDPCFDLKLIVRHVYLIKVQVYISIYGATYSESF